MRIVSGIEKERRQVLRDPFGLVAALLAPPLVVLLYDRLGLERLVFSAQFRETDPAAMVVLLAAWMSALTIAAHAFMRDRREGLLSRLAATPFPPGVLVGGKFVVLGGLFLLQALFTAFLVQLLLPEQTDHATLFDLWLGLAPLVLAGLAAGLLLGAWLTSSLQISQTVTLVTMASLTLSGFLKPLADLGLLGRVSSYLPFSLAYQELRHLFQGDPATALRPLLLVAETLLMLAAAWAILHARMRSRPR